MEKRFVVSEMHVQGHFEPCYSQVLGITSSTELAVKLITDRHPQLEMEERKETENGGLTFALRGKGMEEDGEDLYYTFDIEPFVVDPSDFGDVPVPGVPERD